MPRITYQAEKLAASQQGVLDRLQRSFELTWRASLNGRGPGLSRALPTAFNVRIRYR